MKRAAKPRPQLWFKLRIKRRLWSVYLADDIGGKLGLCLKDRRKIHVLKKLSKREREVVLLHEIMHACLPIADSEYAFAAEEHWVEQLDAPLWDALRRLGLAFPE